MELIDRHKPNFVLLIETRVGGERADVIINSLGFPCYFKVDPMGYTSGLWLLWNTQEINMHIEIHTFQETYPVVEVSNAVSILLTMVALLEVGGNFFGTI